MFEKITAFLLVTITYYQVSCIPEKDANSSIGSTCWSKSPPNYERFPIEFHFFTKNGSNQTYVSRITRIFKQNVSEDYFHPRKRTVLIVHGFRSSCNAKYLKALKNSFLLWEDCNVIVVGWHRGCSILLKYIQAAANTQFVAIMIERLFNKLLGDWQKKGFNKEQWAPVHLVGHSLGAHAVGQAAELLKRDDNFTAFRITGLDPAEPCFEDSNSMLRLSRKNARFVDVVHSDVAFKRNEAFGLLEPIGHADFYLNGIGAQPGCQTRAKTKRFLNYRSLYDHYKQNGSCNHVRAVEIFAESLRHSSSDSECRFWARPWNVTWSSEEEIRYETSRRFDPNDCFQMGIEAENYNFEEFRTFYVVTDEMEPYCVVQNDEFSFFCNGVARGEFLED